MSTNNLEDENSKLRALVKELNTQRHQLINSNKLKDKFLANMSHELKTPLNSIIVISSVMANNSQQKLDEQQVKNLRIINESGHDLLHLINEVLDISKLEAGEMILTLEEIDIHKTLLILKEMFEPLIQKKGLELVCEFDKTVKHIYTDKHKIRQILKNLLSNALKFVEKGKIRLRLQEKNDKFFFTVKDDGIGIPQDKLEHIFDRFQQAEVNTAKKFGGSGLGLSISKELAHLLGGDIKVNSQIDKGTTFTLSLPLSLKKEHIVVQDTEVSVQDSFVIKTVEKQKYLAPCKTKDILVVSQDHLLFFTSLIKLKKMDFNIKQFDYINDALLLLDIEPYDILIMHLIEEINEQEILLKAKELKMKIVIITSNHKQINEADLILKNEQVEKMLVPKLLKL